MADKPQSYYDHADSLDREDAEEIEQMAADYPEQFAPAMQKPSDDTNNNNLFTEVFPAAVDRLFGHKAGDFVRHAEHAIGNFFNPNGGIRHFVARADVLSAIQRACAVTGMDYSLAVKMAAIESGLKADARAGTSSAKGLFQALKGTAATQIKDPAIAGEIAKIGGYDPYDPYASALVGTQYAATNTRGLRQTLGRDPSQGEVYLAHFLGLGGARKILRYNRDAALNVDPAVLAANANVFRGMHTVGDLVAWADRKMANVQVSEKTMVASADHAAVPAVANKPPHGLLKSTLASNDLSPLHANDAPRPTGGRRTGTHGELHPHLEG